MNLKAGLDFPRSTCSYNRLSEYRKTVSFRHTLRAERHPWFAFVVVPFVQLNFGCAIPVAYFPAPSKGSDQKLLLVDDADQRVHADGLLLIKRFQSFSPLGESRLDVQISEVRGGIAETSRHWVFAYIQVGPHPMQPLLPVVEICPKESGGVQAFVPGFFAEVPLDQLSAGRIRLRRNTDDPENASRFWEESIAKLNDHFPPYRLVANHCELNRLAEFVRIHRTEAGSPKAVSHPEGIRPANLSVTHKFRAE